MTANSYWFDFAKSLHEEGVATPVLWLGDDRHYDNAKLLFGSGVVKMLDFVHRPAELNQVQYNGEHASFFESKDYIDTKDICLKMMDRLDLNGVFSRIDREVYFHNLLIWSLKFFETEKPDAVLAIEKPHSHAQYLIFSVARYLGLPTAYFKDCALMPVNFLVLSNGEFLKNSLRIEEAILQKFRSKLELYVATISSLSSNKQSYSPHYMVAQRKNLRAWNRLNNFVRRELKILLRNWASDLKLLFSGYEAVNPFKFTFPRRVYIRYKRKKSLKAAHSVASSLSVLPDKYVYFPLHFEPERTTNPDGGHFHDQFKVLSCLRSFIPPDYTILVKEHPSQFIFAEKGSRGRSPMFYKLISNIQGAKLVSSSADSVSLIRNSSFVCTITGSVALEAALMGKMAIVFGEPWYGNCPNTYNWKNLNTFEEFIDNSIKQPNEIKKHLLSLVEKYGLPMINNSGQLRAYENEWFDSNFRNHQLQHVSEISKSYFDSCKSVKTDSD